MFHRSCLFLFLALSAVCSSIVWCARIHQFADTLAQSIWATTEERCKAGRALCESLYCRITAAATLLAQDSDLLAFIPSRPAAFYPFLGELGASSHYYFCTHRSSRFSPSTRALSFRWRPALPPCMAVGRAKKTTESVPGQSLEQERGPVVRPEKAEYVLVMNITNHDPPPTLALATRARADVFPHYCCAGVFSLPSCFPFPRFSSLSAQSWPVPTTSLVCW